MQFKTLPTKTNQLPKPIIGGNPWTCPSCGKRYRLAAGAAAPDLCAECEAKYTIKRRDMRDEGPGRELVLQVADDPSAATRAPRQLTVEEQTLNCLQQIRRHVTTISAIVLVNFVLSLIGGALIFGFAFLGRMAR